MLTVQSSLQEIKDEFTRITRLPAKKAFASVVAQIGSRKMLSKSDWLWVLENIDFVLTPRIEQVECPVQPETPHETQAESPTGGSWEEEVCALAMASDEPTQVFEEAFSSVDNIKQAYRKLAKYLHPDKGGTSSLFVLMEKAYRDVQNKQSQGYWNGFSQQQSGCDSTFSDEELDEWLR
jgi:hypothetical protein